MLPHVNIHLTEEEQERVRPVAERVAANYRRRPSATGYDAPGLSLEQRQLNGFGAELAVARYTGLRWNAGDAALPDCGTRTEVRQARRADAPLHLRIDTHPSRRYVLVTGSFPEYTLVGWCSGLRGMQEHWWVDKGVTPPACLRSKYVTGHLDPKPLLAEGWMVLQHYLWPMSLLGPEDA